MGPHCLLCSKGEPPVEDTGKPPLAESKDGRPDSSVSSVFSSD